MTARTLHFGRAAEELKASQQALSKRITRLEGVVGGRGGVRRRAGRADRCLGPSVRADARGWPGGAEARCRTTHHSMTGSPTPTTRNSRSPRRLEASPAASVP
ncbi:LysR family transcriptional regulator [Streptomyces chattanoogensis]|uniref:LysR family transcriptional regulator n=1 Tax=Streptomyces chattanoogensis TaxID=66876 RepID=UPI001FE11C49|nr:LysR family transcriptional regulator [Streptomyces chattanoogensis]